MAQLQCEGSGNGAISGIRNDLLLLLAEGRTNGLQFLLLLRIDGRVSEVESLDRFYDGRGDKEPGKPFIVSWHHEPRGVV